MYVFTHRAVDLAIRAALVALAIGAPPLIFAWGEVTPSSRVAAWACTLLGVLGLFVMAGLTIRGRVYGVLVDERNRYSLSRMQITLWTILVIATLYVVFISNLMVQGAWEKALNVNLDWNLVALMGISLASFTAAPLTLSLKAAQPVDPASVARETQELRETQKLDNRPTANGNLLVKKTPNDARLADLIRGEDVGNANTVDLPRTQMLIITVVVVLVYGGTVAQCLLDSKPATLIPKLPELSATLLMFVLVSHGGYLVGKLIPSSTGAGATGEQAGRALLASQRAAAVTAEIQARLNALLPGAPTQAMLQNCLALAQATAAEAATLPARVAVAGFNSEELASMEARISMLQASVGAQLGAAPTTLAADAPSADTVRKVQQKLLALGHAVSVTGISDSPTEQAINLELVKAGVSRTNLHPRAYRYYEELLQLI